MPVTTIIYDRKISVTLAPGSISEREKFEYFMEGSMIKNVFFIETQSKISYSDCPWYELKVLRINQVYYRRFIDKTHKHYNQYLIKKFWQKILKKPSSKA